ncbi:MAG: hypothetical protein ACE5H3_06325 [Planctomycetota bacterium]
MDSVSRALSAEDIEAHKKRVRSLARSLLTEGPGGADGRAQDVWALLLNPDLYAKSDRIKSLFQEPVQEKCLPDIGPVERTGRSCNCRAVTSFTDHGNCAAGTPCTFRYHAEVNPATCDTDVFFLSFQGKTLDINSPKNLEGYIQFPEVYATPGCGQAARPVVKFRALDGTVIGGCRLDLDCNDCKAVIGQG